ncbi:MAG: O-methyltransferase family 2 [Myxococcaceae bacterium]|nr:O-methyltransferase family 2 [Myxococcaceae bacterium]
MRYGTIPTRAAEWLALRLGQVPTPMLDTLLGPMQTRTLLAAQRFGLLARLSSRASVSTLARELALDEECLGLVLRVLQAMRYVRKRGDTWELSRHGRRYFGPGAPKPCSAFIEHAASQWTMMERLDDVLQSGRGVDFHEHQSQADWDAYQRAMLENAQTFAWFVADNVPVPRGATRCVDLAGSHGFVGAALCRKHRGLRSLVLDRAEALPYAEKLASEYGYDELVRFEEGDVRALPLQEPVDVALLCNILHHFSAAENSQILASVRRSMKPGGSLAIFEIEPPASDAPPDAAGDGLALYFRISSTSACFRGAEYVAWLTGAGFVDTRVVRSVRMPSRMLVLGTNPA